MKRMFRKLKSRGVPLRHVCQVGVYLPETSKVIDFIKAGVRTTLVEADPETAEKIREAFDAFNVTIHAVAVWDNPGVLRLSRAASSTFATELPGNPALENDRYVVSEDNIIQVPRVVFSSIDDGSIELLSIDVEGAEWYVLKHLCSAPKVLSIGTHGKYYTNPYIREMLAWLRAHDYELWYRDSSDSIFIKRGLFKVSTADKLERFLAGARERRKKLKGGLKGRD
jgi:FkbM family methyltransferase